MAHPRHDKKTINEAVEMALKTNLAKASKQYGIPTSTLSYHVKKQKDINEAKISKVIQPLKEKSEINPNVTFTKNERAYKRGDIYYVHKFDTVGNEMATGRPAIIVSNDRLNDKIGVVSVVFLTTKNKCLAPEHFTTKATGTLSTVLCEQITTVDKARLGTYIGTITPEDIKFLDKALLSALNLESYTNVRMGDDQIVSRIAAIKAERDAYKTIYDELFNRVMTGDK